MQSIKLEKDLSIYKTVGNRCFVAKNSYANLNDACITVFFISGADA